MKTQTHNYRDASLMPGGGGGTVRLTSAGSRWPDARSGARPPLLPALALLLGVLSMFTPAPVEAQTPAAPHRPDGKAGRRCPVHRLECARAGNRRTHHCLRRALHLRHVGSGGRRRACHEVWRRRRTLYRMGDSPPPKSLDKQLEIYGRTESRHDLPGAGAGVEQTRPRRLIDAGERYTQYG